MKTIRDIEHLDKVKVLVRADFNVPIKNDVVADDFRIRMALPTIKYLLEKGAVVVLVSHLESINGENPSLEPVAKRLGELGIAVQFVKDYKNANEIIDSSQSQCFLLENLRFFEGEKKNDAKFAEQLASLGDIFVNEAFSVCHREHASVVSVPKFLPSYAGLQLEKEFTNLSKAFSPAHPFLFILGGAKFATKLPLLDKFIDIADDIFVCGGLANDIFKAKGYEIGRSITSKDTPDLSRFANNPKMIVPTDVVTDERQEKSADSLSKEDKIMDSGSKTIDMVASKIKSARFILWNGPLGVYEDGYQESTVKVAQKIAEASGSSDSVTAIVGGGDTVAAIESLGISDKFTFMSTAGGAMLEFLAKGSLPGVEALNS